MYVQLKIIHSPGKLRFEMYSKWKYSHGNVFLNFKPFIDIHVLLGELTFT